MAPCRYWQSTLDSGGGQGSYTALILRAEVWTHFIFMCHHKQQWGSHSTQNPNNVITFAFLASTLTLHTEQCYHSGQSYLVSCSVEGVIYRHCKNNFHWNFFAAQHYWTLGMFILNLAISNIEEWKDSNDIKDSNFSSLKLFKLTRSLDGLLEFNRRLNYFVSNQTMRCFKLLLFLSFNK